MNCNDGLTNSALIHGSIQTNSPVRLVFLSGLGTPITNQKEEYFERFAIAHGISYLALDYTKYALQYKMSENFKMGGFSQTTKEIFEKLPEEKLLLFGACFGGAIGLQLAQTMPERIGGIVTISPPLEFPDYPWSKKANEYLRQKLHRKMKGKEVPFDALKRLVILHQLFMCCTRIVSNKPLDTKYQGPTTIFHGKNDSLIPAKNSFHVQEKMKNPNVKVEIVPDVGHTIAIDKEMTQPLAILKSYLDNIKSPQQ